MNELIRELAEKANIEFTYDPTETPVRAFAECWEDELEKFADMIVKKCMDIAKYHTPDTEECEYTWLIHDKIQEYFGVE
jgi:hypothetical protein